MKRRLIEEALPLAAVNAESAREKSLRHGHISTMHLWWARRPLSMSRAVVFGTMLPDPDNERDRQDALNLLALAAPFEAAVRQDRISPLRKLLATAYPDGTPTVLDCFAGGGAIPLEALRLGCDTTALDLNPVAHLIERCVLEYPQRFGTLDATGNNTLAADFRLWATKIRDKVSARLAEVYPADENGRRPAVYFWARTMECANPACRTSVPLLSTLWLASSPRRKAWLKLLPGDHEVLIQVHTGLPPADVDLSVGTMQASSVACPVCGTSMAAETVREYGKRHGFGRRLFAVLDITDGARIYREAHVKESDIAERRVTELLSNLEELGDGTSALPDEAITPSQFRILRSLVYGISTFRGLFNDRQLYVLGTLCEAVREASDTMLQEGMDADRAKAVASYLGLCVDRMADRNSSFCSWDATREGVRSTFPRQAIAMVWDYCEIDPFADISGNWDGAIRWIELAISHCSTTGEKPARVMRGNAQELPFPDGSFDAVIVDPPYYDAMQYGDLSDFFYVWLKRSIGHLYPDVFATPLTPKKQEIIENRAEKKSAEYISHGEFESRLQRAFGEMTRVVKPDGLVAIVFAHTDVEAWEHLLRALRAAGLVVSTSWPMRSEMTARSTAAISAVLSSSVVLVCRRRDAKVEGFFDDVVRELEARIASRLDTFDEMGLVGADYFISAVGPAFEVFASYSRVVRLSGEEVDVSDLMVLARQAVARHAMRRMLGEASLSRLDDESLFYLTWRWAYLTAGIPADEAYKLERAFDVDLRALARPGGIARQTGSTFFLLGPHERRNIRLATAPAVVDVLQLACALWDGGRRRELEELLGATGMGIEPGFWAMARVLAEILPEGERERTMLLGLTGNRDALSQAAAKSTATVEELTLFELGAK